MIWCLLLWCVCCRGISSQKGNFHILNGSNVVPPGFKKAIDTSILNAKRYVYAFDTVFLIKNRSLGQ